MFIYILTLEGKDIPIKIGISKDPKNRVKQLQTGNDEKIVLRYIHAIPKETSILFESLVHKEISYKKILGEWFNFSVEDAILIIEHTLIKYGEELKSKQKNKGT